MEDKEKLLSNAKYLRDTHLNRVGISADLTPQELQEEKNMVEEAERRNRNLTQEDKAKNMKWLVVGQKGEKRLVKGVERTYPTSQTTQPRDQNRNRGRATALPSQQNSYRERMHSKRGHSASDSGEESATKSRGKRRQQQTHPPQTRSQTDTESEEEMEASQTNTGQEVERQGAAQD